MTSSATTITLRRLCHSLHKTFHLTSLNWRLKHWTKWACTQARRPVLHPSSTTLWWAFFPSSRTKFKTNHNFSVKSSKSKWFSSSFCHAFTTHKSSNLKATLPNRSTSRSLIVNPSTSATPKSREKLPTHCSRFWLEVSTMLRCCSNLWAIFSSLWLFRFRIHPTLALHPKTLRIEVKWALQALRTLVQFATWTLLFSSSTMSQLLGTSYLLLMIRSPLRRSNTLMATNSTMLICTSGCECSAILSSPKESTTIQLTSATRIRMLETQPT